MNKAVRILIILFISVNSLLATNTPAFDNPKKFTSEFQFGLRIPTGNVANDLVSGFSLKLGFGYQLTTHWEPVHLAFDFGTSSPQNPDWVTVPDPYGYSYTLQQEMVNIYGFPLTMRFRSQIKDQLELYLGAGVAYYWFSTRLSDPYWGVDLKKSRKRHGPGGLVEAGVFTDAFGEKLLVGLISNVMVLKTNGKTITSPQTANAPDESVSRKEVFLSFAIGLRYYMGK